MKIAIIGGGAAGFFAAIRCAEINPACKITIFERGRDVLEKVRISGGGRCNLTHACPDPRELIKNYPRGSREMLGPFTRFGALDTVEWFKKRGVATKTEADGRMFPVSNSSETIVECLTIAAKKAGVKIRLNARVEHFSPKNPGWELKIGGEERPVFFEKIMVAAGSSPAVWQVLEKLGHRIVAPVPSLFTFNIKDARLAEIPGVAVPKVSVFFREKKIATASPILVTHWGLSGPAILKLSAIGARDFHSVKYHFPIEINWLFDKNLIETGNLLSDAKLNFSKKSILANPQFGLPARLWQKLATAAGISEGLRWADLDKKTAQLFAGQLCAARFEVGGKSTFKEEFVTAGGVDLREVDFKKFESRRCPGLFFAGEILDIDAVTGGFNFQAAWTGGWLAGTAMAGHPENWHQ